MNLKSSKIVIIVFSSIIISLAYNYFNPAGLSLIREKRTLDWESDSLLKSNKIDTPLVDTISFDSKPTVDHSPNNGIKESDDSFIKPKAITLDFAHKLFNEGIQFIDARSAEEFSEGHIRNAVNVPFYGSEKYSDIIASLNKNERVVTYCSSAECDVSTLSADELFELGFKKIYVFIGGYEEWRKNNYPIKTGNN